MTEKGIRLSVWVSAAFALVLGIIAIIVWDDAGRQWLPLAFMSANLGVAIGGLTNLRSLQKEDLS